MGLESCLDDFFGGFSLSADAEGHEYGMVLKESARDFLRLQDKDSAYYLFNSFFDIYRVKCHESKNLVDLLDLLRGYEENAGRLSAKQRDHYVHSANVFILGLCIYSRNAALQRAYALYAQKPGYVACFPTLQEEFLFTWGIASLLHDIGYPVEITHWQLVQFIDYVADEQASDIGPFIDYRNFGRLNYIAARPVGASCDEPPAFAPCLTRGKDDLRPTHLLAERISRNLGLAFGDVDRTVCSFLNVMQRSGFVDHGFYSALIVLKWYGEALIAARADGPRGGGADAGNALFFTQIEDAAAAIFLHNAYRQIFQRHPYDLAPMDAKAFPIAYLLILCDESQEWNRERYGEASLRNLAIDASDIEISDGALKLHYITHSGLLDENYARDKAALIGSMLDIDAVFPQGFNISATSSTERYIDKIKASPVLPRLLAENIEQLARAIHTDYNRKQLERAPERPLEYPEWDSLPDSLKYSNVRQAQAIVTKLKAIGCYAAEPDPEKPPYALTEEDIENLACYEHNLWVEERARNGWTFAGKKDVERKKSPYMIPYDELTEPVKDLDRDTARNIPVLLASVGLQVYSYVSIGRR